MMESKYQIGDVVMLDRSRHPVSARAPLRFSTIDSIDDYYKPSPRTRARVTCSEHTPILIVGHSRTRDIYFILINNSLSYAAEVWADEYTYKVEKSE